MCSQRGVRPSDDDDDPLGEDARTKKNPAMPKAKPFLSDGKRLGAVDPGMKDIVTAVASEVDSAKAGPTVKKAPIARRPRC
jgi:hypothetical protein